MVNIIKDNLFLNLNLIVFLGIKNVVDLITDCLNDASEAKLDGRRCKHEFMLGKVRDCVNDLRRLDRNGKSRPVYDWKLGERLGLTPPAGVTVRATSIQV